MAEGVRRASSSMGPACSADRQALRAALLDELGVLHGLLHGGGKRMGATISPAPGGNGV